MSILNGVEHLNKVKFVLGASVALGALVLSQQANAQAAPTSAEVRDSDSADNGLEDIVVTARKRSENLQQISASVSALSPLEVTRRFDQDVRDFANVAPNVVIDDTQQGPGGVASITIRGIGLAEVEKSIDPVVGVVIDEVYLGTASGGLVKAIDIDRVEVLRGPQGTLFGRNAVAGVINLTRSRPTQELSGKVRATVANYGSRDLDGYVSFGLTDWAAVKFSGAYRVTDGYIRNSFLGNVDAQKSDFQSIGGQLLLTPTSNLEFSFSFDDQNQRQDPPQLQTITRPTDLFCSAYAQCSAPNSTLSGDRYVSVGNGPLNKNAYFDSDMFIAKAKWDISSDMTLNYIYGKYETDEVITQDFDSTPLTLFHTDRPAKYHQDTHELRLNKSSGNLTFVLGGYYFESGYEINLKSYIGFAVPNTVVTVPQTVQQATKSYAAFFEGDYRIGDHFKITVGGRYTRDKKRSGVMDSSINNLSNPASESWSKFTPKVSVSYNFNNNAMIYGLYSQGYRAGGFNGRPSTASAAVIPWNPETVNNYEAGFKTEFLDRRLRVNGSVFFMKYKDKQEDINVPAPGATTGQQTIVANAASAELKGIELDVAATPFSGLTLRGNLGLLDSKYVKFLADVRGSGIITDNSDLKLRRAPKINYTIGGTYEWSMGDTEAWITGTWHYLGAHEITFFNNPALHNKGQNLVDASVNVKFGGTTISGFARNIMKEDGWTIGFDVQGLWSYGAPRPPRTYGIAITQVF